MLKKVFRSFTFWFVLVGVIIVWYNLSGQDDKSIIMVGLNPILSIFSHSSLCLTIAEIPYLWHLLSFLSMTLYGIFFDILVRIIKSKSRTRIRRAGWGLLLLSGVLAIILGRSTFALDMIMSLLGIMMLLLGTFKKI